jgi:hypothetical protein
MEDAGSQAAIESSSATRGDEGNDELVDSGEPLGHSSKLPGSSLLRELSEDDDDDARSTATLGGVALHVAAAATAIAQVPPTVDLPKSPEQHPVASEPADREDAGGEPAGAKRRAQPALNEPAEKRRKPEPAAKDLRRPKVKKVIKRRAAAVAG